MKFIAVDLVSYISLQFQAMHFLEYSSGAIPVTLDVKTAVGSAVIGSYIEEAVIIRGIKKIAEVMHSSYRVLRSMYILVRA